MWIDYDCSKACDAKRERLGDLCFCLAEAWVKQQSYALSRSTSMYDCDLYDYQNADTVKQVTFQYNEEKQLARVELCLSTQGERWHETSDEKKDIEKSFLYFPLWMLKQAAKKGIDYVSWRQVYTGKC